MDIPFYTSFHPRAVLIRAVTLADWSHVVLVDGKDAVEESRELVGKPYDLTVLFGLVHKKMH